MVMRFSVVRLGAIALIALFLPGTVEAMNYGPPHMRVAPPPMVPSSPMSPPATLYPPPPPMAAPVTAGPRPHISLPPGYTFPVCPPPMCGPPPCEERGPLSALVDLVTVPLKILGDRVRSVACRTTSAVPPPCCVPMMPPGLMPPPPRARRPMKCVPRHVPEPVHGAYVPMRP